MSLFAKVAPLLGQVDKDTVVLLTTLITRASKSGDPSAFLKNRIRRVLEQDQDHGDEITPEPPTRGHIRA